MPEMKLVLFKHPFNESSAFKHLDDKTIFSDGQRVHTCNAPNFAVEFFLFFTRQNSGVTFPFSFSPR
jgi:hypothetical protein